MLHNILSHKGITDTFTTPHYGHYISIHSHQLTASGKIRIHNKTPTTPKPCFAIAHTNHWEDRTAISLNQHDRHPHLPKYTPAPSSANTPILSQPLYFTHDRQYIDTDISKYIQQTYWKDLTNSLKTKGSTGWITRNLPQVEQLTKHITPRTLPSTSSPTMHLATPNNFTATNKPNKPITPAHTTPTQPHSTLPHP